MDCRVDIVFVLDESGSVTSTNFALMTSFVSDLVAKLDINSGNTRVGLVTYSSVVDDTVYGLFHLNKYIMMASSMQNAINNLRYSGGGTNTAGALQYVRTKMLKVDKGDRLDVPNAVVVLTDGWSNDWQKTMVCNMMCMISVA